MTQKGADFLLWHCQEPKNRPQFAQYPLPPAVCSPQLSQELSPTPGDPVPAWGLLGHPPSAAGWHKPPALAPARVNVRLASSSPVPAGPPRHFLQAGPQPFFFFGLPPATHRSSRQASSPPSGAVAWKSSAKSRFCVISPPAFAFGGLVWVLPYAPRGFQQRDHFRASSPTSQVFISPASSAPDLHLRILCDFFPLSNCFLNPWQPVLSPGGCVR